jgi:transcriptional regulator with XRE-family HTH domain
MILDDFMTKNKIKNVDLARQIGVTDGFISKLRRFKAVPTIANALIISKACNFKVSVKELISQSYLDDQIKKRNKKNPDFKIGTFNLARAFNKKN